MIIVTGGHGFLGSWVVKELEKKRYEVFVPSRNHFNLFSPEDTYKLFKNVEADGVIHLAADVGGIGYNKNHPYQLIYNNLRINTNVINEAIRFGIKKFLNVSTTCSYPKWANPPFREEILFDGYPEETNAPYGIAKRVAMEQVKAAYHEFGFNGISVIPTNLFGPSDNYDPKESHVIPALIKKMFDAIDNKEDVVEVWGTGKATRDFLYVEDAAEAIVLCYEEHDNPEIPLNIGSGREVSIAELVHFIQKIAGYKGKIKWDISKPDGQPKRALNTNKLRTVTGWEPKFTLQEGLEKTINDYKESRYG